MTRVNRRTGTGYCLLVAVGLFTLSCDRGQAPPSESSAEAESAREIVKRLEETDPTDRLPKPEDVRVEPRTIVAKSPESLKARVPVRPRAVAKPPVAKTPEQTPPSDENSAEKTPRTAESPAKSPVAAPPPKSPPALPEAAGTGPGAGCRALAAECDGRSYRTDVCVRDLPGCPAGATEKATGCCPSACVEAYRSRRRSGAEVPAAYAAVFGSASDACWKTLAAAPRAVTPTEPPAANGDQGEAPARPAIPRATP